MIIFELRNEVVFDGCLLAFLRKPVVLKIVVATYAAYLLSFE